MNENSEHVKKPLETQEIHEDVTTIDEKQIVNTLLKISFKLRKLSNHDKKILILVDLDDFLNKNKKIIKEKYSDLLVSILNSL